MGNQVTTIEIVEIAGKNQTMIRMFVTQTTSSINKIVIQLFVTFGRSTWRMINNTDSYARQRSRQAFGAQSEPQAHY